MVRQAAALDDKPIIFPAMHDAQAACDELELIMLLLRLLDVLPDLVAAPACEPPDEDGRGNQPFSSQISIKGPIGSKSRSFSSPNKRPTLTKCIKHVLSSLYAFKFQQSIQCAW